MTMEIEERVWDRALAVGLAELHGLAEPEGSGRRRAAQLQLLPTREPGGDRSLRRLAPFLLAAAALAVLARIWSGVGRDDPPGTDVESPVDTPRQSPDYVDVRSLEELQQLSRATPALRLRGPSIQQLRLLREFGDLTALELRSERPQFVVRPASLRNDEIALLAALPRLRSLTIKDHFGFDGAGLRQLRGLPELASLRLERSGGPRGRLDDDHLSAVAALPRLTALSLIGGADITDAGLAALADAAGLRSLRLGLVGHTASAAGYAALSSLRRLRELDVDPPINRFEDHFASGVMLFAEPEHEQFDLDQVSVVDDAVLASFADLPELRTLRASYSSVSDVGVAALSRCRTLAELQLDGCRGVTSTGLRTLPISLQVLALRGCPVGSSIPSHLVELHTLSLSRTVLTDPAWLAALPSLRNLELVACSWHSRAAAMALVQLHHLRLLNLRGCSWADDAVLRALATMPELATVDLSGLRGEVVVGGRTERGTMTYTGAGLAALAASPSLLRLALDYGPRLPVAALRGLAHRPLQRLTMFATPIIFDEVTADAQAVEALWPDGRVQLGPR